MILNSTKREVFLYQVKNKSMGEQKKLLHELLEDDQEPFHLNHYISDLRTQMGYSDLRLKKRKSLSFSTNVPPNFFSCQNSCFFATHKSPNPTKSPLFDLRSPAKKKARDARVFLQIPARTAAVLLEAAARIQKQQSEKAKTNNNKARNRGNAFALFGSVLKRLTNRKTKPRLDNAVSLERGSEPTSSSSWRRERFVEIGEKCFCESPFHFVLQTTSSSSSSGHRTPHFTSTATSPARRSTQDEDSDETESLEKAREDNKEEEDKEQCSPVSVLDPLEEEEEEEDEDHNHLHDDSDHLNLLSCSFEVVQRAKRRLLKKLRRFEKLAGLDPVELEEKMSEEEEEYDESEFDEDDNVTVYDSDEEYDDVDEAMALGCVCVEAEKKRKNVERQKKWRMMNEWRVGLGAEEDVDAVVRKDLKEEAREWTRYGGEVEEAVCDLELSIFIFLIDEFTHELASSS